MIFFFSAKLPVTQFFRSIDVECLPWLTGMLLGNQYVMENITED